jgi:hypothetical protein
MQVNDNLAIFHNDNCHISKTENAGMEGIEWLYIWGHEKGVYSNWDGF